MGKYLTALKMATSGAPLPPALQELQEAPSRSSCSIPSASFSIIAEGASGSTRPHAHRRWRIQANGRPPKEVIFAPSITAAEVAARYPGAVLEQLSEPVPRPPTEAEAVELRRLVAAIARRHGWDGESITAAESVGLADIDDALTCLRELVEDGGAGGDVRRDRHDRPGGSDEEPP